MTKVSNLIKKVFCIIIVIALSICMVPLVSDLNSNESMAYGAEIVVTRDDEAKFLEAFRNGEDGTIINLNGEVVTVRGQADEFLSNSHNITIKNGTLALRFGGIVCGGNLTLQDVDLNFTSTTASGCIIAANGYNLTLDSVKNTNSAINEITIFGGKVVNTQYSVPAMGGWGSSVVNISGTNNLGKIFMGSFDAMNGGSQSSTSADFSSCTINVDNNCTKITENKDSNIVYASGGYPQTRTTFVPDVNKYPITSSATINTYEDLISTIEGDTGRNLKAIVNFNGGQYAIDTLTLHNIKEINVKTGKLKLKSDTTFGQTFAKIALGVSAGATLYAGEIGNKTFTYFNGGGTLNLGRSKTDIAQTLKFNDAITGTTEVEFGNTPNFRYAGIVNNIYIDAPKSAANSFAVNNLASGQSGYWTRNSSGQWFFSSTQPTEHQHTYDYDHYTYNETEHWLQCTDAGCPDLEGSKIGFAAHEYENDNTRKCTYCDYKRVIIHDIFVAKDDSKLEKLKARVFNGILHSQSSIDVSDIGITSSEIVYTTADGTSLTAESALRQMIRDNPFLSTLATTGVPTFTKSGNVINSIGVTISQYTWKPETISLACEAYEEVMEKISSDMTDVQKLAIIHDWECNHVNYSLNASMADFAIGALANGKAVCAGYAQCYQFLLNQLGIENVYVAADTPKEPHAWNLVKIDGYWFHVDTTWDDGVAGSSGYHHSFFLLNDDEFLASGDDDSDGIGTHGRAWLDSGQYPTNNKAYFDNKYWLGINGELSTEMLSQDPRLTIKTVPDPDPDPAPDPDPDPDPEPATSTVKVQYGGHSAAQGATSITLNGAQVDDGTKVKAGDVLNFTTKHVEWGGNVVLVKSAKINNDQIFSSDNIYKGAWRSSPDSSVIWSNIVNSVDTFSYAIPENSSDEVVIDVQFQELSPIWRLFNPTTKEHVFTSSRAEYDFNVNGGFGVYYNGEGIDWFAPASSDTGIVRLFNAAYARRGLCAHYYCTKREAEEVRRAFPGEWEYDFNGSPVFYSGGDIPVYTAFKASENMSHHYTTDRFEYDTLASWGWDLEPQKSFVNGVATGIFRAAMKGM